MKLVLFDLDGTLYSSRNILPLSYQDGIEAFNDTHTANVNVPSDERIFDQVGKPVDTIYRTLFPDLSTDQLTDLRDAIFSSLLERIEEGKGRVFEGVHPVLGQLSQDRRLGVVTNAQTPYMDAVLQAQDLNRYFQKTLCNDDAPSGKKSELVTMQLEHFGVPAERTLLVGDRESDRTAARTHGVNFVGCTYGYWGGSLFDDERTLEQMTDLPDLVRNLTHA